ncbi:uncharacterized protein LOC131020090 [Salvia miltiorrhiza]|uniref:uncharacterized protein LOC131020090 n=1 Tax=Salvia miltiorrhiza TaxID=226208 RepID=UPI0025AC11DA|nr:uncharacterized protein LOC131020090 [Salvia miltiorrhiza]
MDPDEIARRVADLQLATENSTKIIRMTAQESESENKKASTMLIGKIFADRQHPRDLLREKIPAVLQIRGYVDVEIVGFNVFVLHLDLETDLARILTDGPWHLFNDLMVIRRPDPLKTASTTEFIDISIWIQLHNLALACMNSRMVRRIGEKVGAVMEVEEGEGGRCLGKFARARVLRSIQEPLVRCVSIEVEGNKEPMMVLVLYEKLLDNFCFACGKIGHFLKNCDASKEAKAKPSFGNWLRA